MYFLIFKNLIIGCLIIGLLIYKIFGFTFFYYTKKKKYKVSLIKISTIFSLKNDLEIILSLSLTRNSSITLF